MESSDSNDEFPIKSRTGGEFLRYLNWLIASLLQNFTKLHLLKPEVNKKE